MTWFFQLVFQLVHEVWEGLDLEEQGAVYEVVARDQGEDRIDPSSPAISPGENIPTPFVPV